MNPVPANHNQNSGYGYGRNIPVLVVAYQELYLRYHPIYSTGTYKKAKLPEPVFESPICKTELPVDGFLNPMTISYQKVNILCIHEAGLVFF